MTVSRLPLINPSFRTNHPTRSLSIFSRLYCSASPNFSGTSDAGARHRHGTKRPARRRRGFYMDKVVKEESLDYYKIMKVAQNATAEQIKHCFYKLSKEFHPESIHQRENGSRDEWDQVNDAYATLKKPVKRREYDRKLNASKSASSTAAEKPFDPKEWLEQFDRQQEEAAAGGAKQIAAPQQPSPEEPYQPPPPHELSRRTKLRRARKEGKDPMGSLFGSSAGRGSATGVWLIRGSPLFGNW